MIGRNLIIGGLAAIHPILAGIIALVSVLFSVGVVFLVVLFIVPLVSISVAVSVLAAIGVVLLILSVPILLIAIPFWIGWKILLR